VLEVALEQKRVDARTRDEDDGLFFVASTTSCSARGNNVRTIGSKLCTRKRNEIGLAHRRVIQSLDRTNERTTKVLVCTVRKLP
jgi:hypothetical protein